jgi:hypothetical protein
MKLANASGFSSATWPVANWWGQAGYTFVRDFNGDGRADIATAIGGSINLMTSTGSGFVHDWPCRARELAARTSQVHERVATARGRPRWEDRSRVAQRLYLEAIRVHWRGFREARLVAHLRCEFSSLAFQVRRVRIRRPLPSSTESEGSPAKATLLIFGSRVGWNGGRRLVAERVSPCSRCVRATSASRAAEPGADRVD